MADRKKLSRGDSVFDQKHAEIRDAARADIAEWGRFSRKIKDAADTRLSCEATSWTPEEMYRLVRLADLATHYVTGRLLGRKI